MALDKRHSTFVIKFLWILLLVFQESNLVICDVLEDDSLKNALEAIERRQRDLELQDNEYYGQPENIGYGFQKTLGFFDNGPANEFGSFESEPKHDKELQNLFLTYGSNQKSSDYKNGYDKRKSNFRERMANSKYSYLIKNRENEDEYPDSGIEYLQMLKNLWSKYRESRPDNFNIEDLTDEQVEELISSLYDEGNDEKFGNDYRSSQQNGFDQFEVIPIKNRKNYRVFDRVNDRGKRYPSFGEGIYGKRNLRTQNLNYDAPPENDFLYSLKYVNPEANREAVERLREEGFEVLGDEKDKDIIRILNNAMNRPKYEDEESSWSKDQNGYDDDVWLQGPVTFDDGYEELGRNEKRDELTPKFFKQHNGIHLNTKRYPVKRSSIRVRKEIKSDKGIKDLKDVSGTPEPTVTTVKVPEKKPTEVEKKQNITKPEVTRHHEPKKVVRRSDKNTKEQLSSVPASSEEIENLFRVNKKSVSKKSIDWSQYFGIDKRSPQTWLKNDYLRRAEGLIMTPRSKRFSFDRGNVGNVNILDRSQIETPFDTRKFNKKGYSYDIGSNIDKVENKIGDIEEKIIDDAVKYTGAHSGASNEDLIKVKSKVIQRLEAAYSLEKMKNALEEFKNLIKPEKSFLAKEPAKTSTEAPKPVTHSTTVVKENPVTDKPTTDKKTNVDTSKRVATKKEEAKGLFSSESSDGLEFLNEGAYGNRPYENEVCPVLDKILHNCLRVEEMGGRFAELLVPLCRLQQICYVCGPELGFSKMSVCDAMYLTEAQNICQGNSECLINARDSMLALQDLYEQDLTNEESSPLLSGSCLFKTCIQRYFLNSPGAIYPLQIQN